MKRFLLSLTALTLIAAAGCKLLDTVSQVATSAAVAGGAITPGQAEGINKTVSATGKALFDKLTTENEYWIGRSVGATILQTYKPYDNEAANRYINVLGQTMALSSDRPETFGGYHFLIIDTDEINAFAAPGGLIFVSRGLIKCCKDEDALASVLAHEVAHVQLLHGLKSITTSRFKDAAFTAGIEATKALAGDQLAQFVTVFEGTLNDITSKLVVNGYSHSLEFDADATAITIIKRAGYNPEGLREMLKQMEVLLKPGKGFGKTHPTPAERIKAIDSKLKGAGAVAKPAARQARFLKAMTGV